MLIAELYQAFDNLTLLTKFYIVNSEGDMLAWGSDYTEIPYQVLSMPIVHFQYNDGEINIWV